MPPLEEQESTAGTVDLGLPSPPSGAPPTYAHDDSDIPAGLHDNQLGPEDTVLKEGPRPENIKPSVLDTSFGNVEAESNIQDASLSKEGSEYDITASQYADLEPECQGRGDSTSFGVLSPASERILQDADLAISIPSPKMNGRFIKRYDAHEDVMEEIKSAFKFAKKENAQCLDQTFNTKSNQHSADTSNHPHRLKPNYVFTQPRNTFSLPLRLTSDLTNNEFLNPPHLLKDSSSSLSKDDTSLPTSDANLNVHSSLAFDEHHCETSETPIPQEDIGAIVFPINQEVNPSHLASNCQPTTSLKEEGLDSFQARSFEWPDQSVRSANVAVSCASQVITIPDTNPRRSQTFQKVPPINRIRIKQPFPEVAQTSSSRIHQSSTQVLGQDHRHCERYLNQPTPTTELSTSEIDANCQSVLAMPTGSDMTLHPKLLITDGLHVGVSRRQASPQQNFILLSTEMHRTSSLAEEVQNANPGLPVTNKGEGINEPLQDNTLSKLTSHHQQNRREQLHKTIHVLNPHEQSSTDYKSSEAMAINDVVTHCPQSDNLLPTSENQVQRKPASIPSLSQPQKRSHGNNPLIPLSKDVLDTFDHIQKTSEPGSYNNDARIRKSKSLHNYKRDIHRYSSPPIQQPRLLSKVAQAQQTLIKHSQEVEDILDDCQRQKEVIQSQKSELERLKTFDVEKSEKIQALELEKKAQKAKIKKFEQLSGKYKDHMNEVVLSQKQLLRESQRIRKVETDLKSFQEAYITREAHIKKLECLLAEVKEFRRPAEKLLAAQQENGELINVIQETSKTNELLQSDLNKKVIELGRERHTVSQLQKQLNAQTETQKQLVEHLRNTRSGIIDDLTRESGILAKILYSESSVKEKLEQVLFTVNDMKSHEQNFQPALVKLIEDLSMRFGNILQTTENNSELLRNSHLKHFIDLKERLDKARLDKKTEGQLNDIVTTLRETNATLSTSLSARESECKGMTTRMASLELGLTSIRGVLSTKCDELNVALALSKDDPQLRERCHDLERKTTALEDQLDITTRDNISIKKELDTLRKDSLETEKQFHQLQNIYNEAQSSIKKFSEERKAYISNAKLDIEKARQDVAKSSIAAKNELIMRYDALVNNLEQRRSEAELEVTRMKGELQRLQAERETYASRNTQLQREVSAFRETTIQQSKNIERLERQSTSQVQFEQQETSLECTRGEIAELKNRLEYVKNNSTEDINAALRISREIESRLRKVDDLEHEKESLKAQHLILRKKYDAIGVSTTQFTKKANSPDPQEECETRVQTSLEMGPPKFIERANEGFNLNHEVKSHSLRQSYEIQRNKSGPRLSMPTNTRSFSLGATVTGSGRDQNTTKSSQFTDCNTFMTHHPIEDSDASSVLQLPYKPLKVANRRAHQSSRTDPALSDKDTTAYNLRQSIVTHTSHTTQETTIRAQTPSEEITPFSNFSPIQSHPPSSFTDVSPIIDHLEAVNNQQDLHKICATTRTIKQYGSPAEYIHSLRNADIWSLTENSSPETTRSRYNSSYQPPNRSNKEVGVMKNSGERVPVIRELQQELAVVAHKGPVPQNTSTRLKSALKKPTNIIKAINNLSTTSKPTNVLKNMPSSRGANKNQRQPAPELGYKRVASGQVIKSKGDNAARFNDMFPGGGHAHHQSSQYQSSSRISEKSPLMPGPRRNERKRSASALLGSEQTPKLSKAPRTSLHLKSAASVIPNSQMIPNS